MIRIHMKTNKQTFIAHTCEVVRAPYPTNVIVSRACALLYDDRDGDDDGLPAQPTSVVECIECVLWRGRTLRVWCAKADIVVPVNDNTAVPDRRLLN